MSRYRVTFQNGAGKRERIVVDADSESAAILAAKQKLRKDHPRFAVVSSAAIRTED